MDSRTSKTVQETYLSWCILFYSLELASLVIKRKKPIESPSILLFPIETFWRPHPKRLQLNQTMLDFALWLFEVSTIIVF